MFRSWCSGRGVRLGLLRPPRPQSLDRCLSTDETLIHPDRKHVLVCAAQHRSRGYPEDLGDLVAVQLGPNRVELLLLQQTGDTGFEVVIDPREATCLAHVARRAVRSGQAVQSWQQRPGVSDI